MGEGSLVGSDRTALVNQELIHVREVGRRLTQKGVDRVVGPMVGHPLSPEPETDIPMVGRRQEWHWFLTGKTG
jgi:hypothetical protein